MTTKNLTDLMRPEVALLARAAHGGQGWRSPGLEDFSANLNPLGAPRELAAIVAGAVLDLGHYPDDSCTRFRGTAAAKYGLRGENVIAGAGSSEIIRLFPEVFIQRGDRVLMPWPTFAEYAVACRLMGAEVVQAPLSESANFRPDVGELFRLLDRSFKAVYLCNPNNPTGMLCRKKEVQELVEECERLGVIVFLDETLLELSGQEKEQSLAFEAEGHSNLLIIRSLTKSFAIPGMRLGYGLGSQQMISCLDRARQSWNLGQIEQEVGAALLLDHQDHVDNGAKILEREVACVHTKLNGLGALSMQKPDAFYFFLDLRPLGLTAAEVVARLSKQGVLVRDCASFGKPFDRFVRFSVKTPEKNERLLQAFKAVLDAKEGPG